MKLPAKLRRWSSEWGVCRRKEGVMLSDSALLAWDAVWRNAGFALSAAESADTLFVVLGVLLWVGLPVAGVWFGVKAMRLRRLVRELPTCKAKGVFVGQVEMKGDAVSEAPLASFLAEAPCVWYEYSVEEHWRRVRVETYTDSKGNVRTRTRVDTGWETVASDKAWQSFFLQDDTGAVLVHPAGAEVEPVQVFSRQCSMGDPLYYGKGPSGSVSGSTHERRFTERAIPAGQRLYLLGTARERKDCAAAEVAKAGFAEDVFLISCRSEDEIARSSGWKSWLYPVGGGCALLLGTVLLADGVPPGALKALLVQLAAYFMLAWLCAAGWTMYAGMVRMRNRVQAAWAMIEVQLQRRHSLVPDLVRVVEGYAAYERQLQEDVALLRAGQAGAAAFRMRAEAFPELKADAVFAELSRRLVDAEDRVALAREYFNTLAGHFNAAVSRFPDVLFARVCGMKAAALWRPDDAGAVARPPQV